MQKSCGENMKVNRLFHLSLVTLLIFGVVASGVSMAASDETTIVYVNPPYNSVPAVPVNQTFTVNISVAAVTDLNAWQFKLYIKKSVLYTDSSLIKEGPFLSQDGAYLTEITENYDGMYWNVGCHIVGADSTNGSGILASVTFKALKEGESNIALIETKLWNPDINPIPHTNKGGYFNSDKVEVINEVEVDGHNFTIITTTNSSVSPVPFNLDIGQKEIRFDVIGLAGLTGYCNISIPKSFMRDDWEVTVGGSPPASLTITENLTHTFLYFTYATSAQEVRITSTYIVPEYSASIFLSLLIIATLAATLITKKFWLTRQKLSRNRGS